MTEADLFAESCLFLLGSDMIERRNEVGQTGGQVLAGGDWRLVDVHGVGVLKTWVPEMTGA